MKNKLLILLMLSSSLDAKRVEMRVNEIKPLSSHIFVGFVNSLNKDVFKITVLKQYSGDDSLRETILIKQLQMTKPTENPEVGKAYLIFVKKHADAGYKIVRRLEISDFSIGSHELNDQKIKTQCEVTNVSCLLK